MVHREPRVERAAAWAQFFRFGAGPFSGGPLLEPISIVTIVGWAWVMYRGVRWIFQNIEGTRREILFKGTGLEILWRSIVTMIASYFIIPIPWMYRWMWRWKASQTVLVERGTQANA